MSVHLVAAYAVFWSFTFLLVVSLWSRQNRIEGDIGALKEKLEETESLDS